MRLLKYGEDGCLTITSFNDDAIPQYAILSHTWGEDAEEVTFADLAKADGKHKSGYKKMFSYKKMPGYKKMHGYKKIRFCGEQAQEDGLQYFWVDTCCIDKSDKAELSHAIQSMFYWYQNATKCYVYLSDVSTKVKKVNNVSTEFTWEPAFRSSRWFTRGWTLQELLAPSKAEFYSLEWEKLGDKMLLKSLIHKITSISCKALEGAPLSQFSINERLRWIEHRHTTRPEDKAYSLLGVVDVDLAPCYGEGVDGAFKRLHDEINKTKRCIQDLCGTDPCNDKKRIEDTKGGLLKDSYRWVFHNDSFRRWHEDSQSRLLWIKGDPGKGKTMLLCGIIDELQAPSAIAKTNKVSYFFCQATDARINSATAVLRGLLYMLVKQQPSLASHIRKKYDEAGKNMFEDANAWVALAEIFADVLRDSSLITTYLIVDALDECVTDRPKLLDFIAKQSSVSSRVNWVVSSRNWPDIEVQLGHKARISLELNAESIAAAVAVFIQLKVSQLAQEKQYEAEVRDAVLQHLTTNANDTFLWVALVCQELKKTANRHVLRKLAVFPTGLDDLYKRMMQQMSQSDDAETCRCVLALAAILYRPVTISELVALVEQLEELDNLELVREIIGFCGSFLTLREDTVYFVHQSAKEFLFAQAHNEVFPDGGEAVHQMIFSRSLAILSETLCRDMYSLEAPGYPIENVQLSEADSLAVIRYPCISWIDHLCDSEPNSRANRAGSLQVLGAVDEFLREKFLYWLEGLSLCKSVGRGVILIEKLLSLVQVYHTRSTFI
jgi:hypothetical protein